VEFLRLRSGTVCLTVHTFYVRVGRICRCLLGVRGRVIAHTEIYPDSEVVEFYISDHPELSVCLTVHTFYVRVGRICRCLLGVRGRVIAHTEIYPDSEVVEFYISDHPELSVCLTVHTFYVRVGRICRSDIDGERFSEPS